MQTRKVLPFTPKPVVIPETVCGQKITKKQIVDIQPLANLRFQFAVLLEMFNTLCVNTQVAPVKSKGGH